MTSTRSEIAPILEEPTGRYLSSYAHICVLFGYAGGCYHTCQESWQSQHYREDPDPRSPRVLTLRSFSIPRVWREKSSSSPRRPPSSRKATEPSTCCTFNTA